jgi:hypothetical protein
MSDRDLWYRVQVRAPFGDWHDAALSLDPVRRVNVGGYTSSGATSEAEPDVGNEAAPASNASLFDPSEMQRSIAAECGRALCTDFIYAHPALQADTALCADVVGFFGEDEGGNEIQYPLESHGTYSVRVLADFKVPSHLVAEHNLPTLLQSPPAAVSHRTSLVPQVMIPVGMSADAMSQSSNMGAMNVSAMVAINYNRYALVDGSETMMVLGSLDESVLKDADIGWEEASSDGMYLEGDTTAEAQGAAQSTNDGTVIQGRLLAMLPAGKWVRLWKQVIDPVDGQEAMVRKVFIGEDQGDGTTNQQSVPVFPVDFRDGLEDRFRSFHWLSRPEGSATDAGYNPGDGYLLLFDTGLVLLERGPPMALRMRNLGIALDGLTLAGIGPFDVEFDNATKPYWGDRVDDLDPNTFNPQAGRGDLCRHPNLGALKMRPTQTHAPLDDGTLERSVRICIDLGHALGEQVDLSDVLTLSSGNTLSLEGDALVDATVHLISDRARGVVFAMQSKHLMGRTGAYALPDLISEIPVGEGPAAMLNTTTLSCPGGDGSPVALVANTGSRDLSILQVAASGQVIESRVVPLPAGPTGFIVDSKPLTCTDPFVWVKTEEGTLIPLDMRSEVLDVPLCGSGPCQVLTRGRIAVGSIGRAPTGRGRVMLGGRGIVSEGGFLRPADAF